VHVNTSLVFYCVHTTVQRQCSAVAAVHGQADDSTAVVIALIEQYCTVDKTASESVNKSEHYRQQCTRHSSTTIVYRTVRGVCKLLALAVAAIARYDAPVCHGALELSHCGHPACTSLRACYCAYMIACDKQLIIALLPHWLAAVSTILSRHVHCVPLYDTK
jgi:hypothetical protein